MSLFGRFFEFIRYPSHSRTMGILAFLVVLLAIPLTVNIAQKQQEIRQRAESCTPGVGLTCNNGASTVSCNADFNRDCTCPGGYVGKEVFASQNNGTCYSDGSCYATCPTAPPTSGAGFVPTMQLPTIPPLSSPTQTPNPNVQCYVPWSLEISRLNCTSYSGPNNCVLGFQPYLCAGGSASTPVPSCTGTCLGSGQCTNEGGTVIPDETCTGGDKECCQFPATDTCTPQGYSCDFKNLSACDANGVVCAIQSSYSCSNGNLCIKITEPPTSGGATGTCSSGPSSDWSYTCGCTSTEDNVPGGGHTALCTKNPSQTDSNYCWSNALHPGSGCTTSPSGTAPVASGPTSCDLSAKSGTGWQWNYVCGCTSTDNGKNEPGHNAVCSVNPQQDTHCYSNVTNPVSQCPVASSPTASSGPTPTPAASATPSSGAVSITFNIPGILLHGIGGTGDVKNAGSKVEQTPRHPQRTFVVGLYKNASDSTPAYTGSSNMNYQSGGFIGTVNVPNAPTGSYYAKISSPGYLKVWISQTAHQPQLLSLTVGQTYTSPAIIMITGDLNGDNKVDAFDYTAFSACFGKNPSGSCAASDLDDNGVIDIYDFNLLLREFNRNGD